MHEIEASLRDAIPEAKVRSDLVRIVAEADYELMLEGNRTRLPADLQLKVVARSFHHYSFDMGFGSHYRVPVAVGGVESVEFGVVTPEICFATLWYSKDLKLITVDFSLMQP